MHRLSKLFLLCGMFIVISGTAIAATFTVTHTGDVNDGTCDADCSLREAINATNGTPDDDTINFDPATFGTPQTIVLAGVELMLTANGSLTIDGPGADLLTISGNNSSRVLSTSAGVVAHITGITFANGNSVGAINSGRGGAVYNAGATLILEDCVIANSISSSGGGGLNNASNGSPSQPGNVTLLNCTFSGNTSTGTGGGIQNFSTSTLHIINSTFIGNVSNGSSGGGGIGVNGIVTITNSTFTGNNAASANGRGGGVQTNGSSFIMTNTTIVGNSSGGVGGGYARVSSNLNNFVRNTIIAGNSGHSDSPDAFATASVSSMGNNIVGVVGTSTGWVKSDLLNTDPMVSPPGNFGGDTMTISLRSGSPALNGGQNCVRDLSCAENNPPVIVSADQRGAARDDSDVDIGAFEVSSSYLAELPNGTVTEEYDYLLVSDMTNFFFGATGNIPPGLSLQPPANGEAGTLSLVGIPSLPGTYTFDLILTTTGEGTASIPYSITIDGSAASASISGKVLALNGGGVGNAIVKISNTNGPVGSYRTNNFGRFQFNDLPTNVTYTISVASKTGPYEPAIIDLTGDVTGLEITPKVEERK